MKKQSSPEFISREVRLDTPVYEDMEGVNPQVDIDSVYGVLILYPDNIVFRAESKDGLMTTEYRTVIDRSKIKSLQLFGNKVSDKATYMRILAGLMSVLYAGVSSYYTMDVLRNGISEIGPFSILPIISLGISLYFILELISLSTSEVYKLSISDGQNKYIISGEPSTLYQIYANLSQEIQISENSEAEQK